MGSKGSKNQRESNNRKSLSADPGSSSEDEADGGVDCAAPTTNHSEKGSKKGKTSMTMFRSQSEAAKKRMQHQQYLAQEDPEPVFDLSNCELEEVPSSTFPLCKVLQKEVLLLNNNWLAGLHGSGSLSDLVSIRVLDVHNNEIKSVPGEISLLQSLQVLNLENNRLKKLPDEIGQLRCLQTLNVKSNRLTALPSTVCDLKSLRMLDIQVNCVTALPRQLCHVRTLESLSLDASTMKYPPQEICLSGTEDIMKFLCAESGMEYLPPSNFLLEVLEPPKIPVNKTASSMALKEEENMAKSFAGYSDMMEKRRLELIEVERSFAAHQELQAQMALLAQQNRDQLVRVIEQAESKLDSELNKLSREREVNQKRLIRDLQIVEEGADKLISSLLDMSAKARQTEELLDAIEQERIKEDKLFEVRWEELQNLRKKEVLNNMQTILQENETFEMLLHKFTSEKGHSLMRAIENDEMMSTAQVASVLQHKDQQTSLLLADLVKQEALQREAFEALQLQKDVKNQRIRGQIALIQDELASLTVVEIEKRGCRMEEEMNRLAEKRNALIELLAQLMEEQDRRQIELRHRMDEMEQQRENGQADYWLVQFQRLMDQKPNSLIDREQRLEISVVKILNQSHAEDHIPRFARHRITIETMLTLDDDDLKMMGVHEMGVRREILRNIQGYRDKNTTPSFKAAQNDDFNIPRAACPSAPALPQSQILVIARGLNSECSICMDNTSDVIFMNCGHVCSCSECCEKVAECPLCRASIVRRVKLMTTHV
ncbi:E3 ubiquitin-protein ligase LRSAM1-like isoform X2 [Dreissena polymorpha]|nr:E3 ubiquitin-protein ligase LRSAM1-like isoform X2 [Dreissena polymorpha]XP_052223150.1 E3 ubiquitin-protein ligase LRSAM1-like isoform X2 [Dreissena polymorpha]XP_052223151.1 E3 ubiquitin-protein ligase LRSAM1-like isoform X2 [Dreissena polymorpha]XP_052223152.1 E3 ubiquitin-protein ligase LRSAM1-like isoform X2 [Dreissena polymorpha]